MPLTPPRIRYANGQEEAIPFPDLTISERQRFVTLLAAGDSVGIVALCAHRTIDWVNSLDFACYNELARYCLRRNFSWTMEMATHDPIVGLKVGPMLLQMASFLNSAPSLTSLPTPAAASPNGNGSPSAPAPAAAAAPTLPPA